MIDGILAKRNASTKACITVKTLISLVVIAMAVALPQILHVATGAAGGVKWLPMYLPVIIGACVLGAKWGVAAAVLSPITSFLLTSAVSSPCPLRHAFLSWLPNLPQWRWLQAHFPRLSLKTRLGALPQPPLRS